MRIFFMFLLVVTTLFSFDMNKAKKILDSNNTNEIIQTFRSNNGFWFLGTAIKENRLDVLKLAVKNGFDFTQTDDRGNTLLDLSAFFLNTKAVKLLIPLIDPNHLSKRGLNSLRFLLSGIEQEYRWIFYPKEKLIKIYKDDNISKENMNKSLMLRDVLRQNAFDIIKILKQNGARFEMSGAYPNEITFFISARRGRINNKFKYKLIEKLLDDKGKLFFYIGMNEFDKAKSFIDEHPQILKEPYFLDYNRHFFYILQKDKKYCGIVKYMIQKALQNHFRILEYYVTNNKDETFYDKAKGKCFEKLYKKYEYKLKYNYKPFDIFKFIKEKDYKNLEKYVSEPGWNFTVWKDDIPSKFMPRAYNPVIEEHTTPFLQAVFGYERDEKIINIMLKNGGYMSGWNEIHYNIIKHKPLHLEKYSKWDRVFKLNQGDLAKNIKPIHLALLYGDLDLVKKLIKNGAKINVKLSNGFDLLRFAIDYDVNDDKIKYILSKVKYIDSNTLKSLAFHKKFEILEFIKKNNFHSKYSSLNKMAKEVYHELQNVKLPPKQEQRFKKEILKRFQKLFDIQIDYTKMLVNAIYENDTKKALLALKNGADVDAKPIFFGKSASLLMAATLKDNKKIVKALIKHKANVLFKNKHGNTFLHVASQNDILPIALNSKAKRYINDPVDLILFKAYPITIALFNKQYNNVKLLLKYGAKLPNKSKKKVFCYLKKKKLKDLINEFKRYGYSFKGIMCH